MPDEDKPVPLRPATPSRARLRPVREPEPDLEDEREEPESATRLVDRIQELAERIEEETAASRTAVERQSQAPARAVREAAAKHAESAAQRVAEIARGRHEAPLPLPPLPLPGDSEPDAGAVTGPEEPDGAPLSAGPVKKGPAKKAPARRTTAVTLDKAAATKAPAKKAAGTGTTSAVKKAPSPRAPAKKGTPGTPPAPGVQRGVPAPPARPLPRPSRPAVGGAAPVASASPAPAAPPRAVAPTTPAAPPHPIATTTAAPVRRRSRLGRLLLAMSVLLLAVAAGLGVAAYVESGEETWESRVAIRLIPGPVPTVDPSTAVKNGIDRYTDKVPGLTLTAASDMGIPEQDVRGTFEAVNPEPDVIGIIVHAAHTNQAALLAGAAASELIKAVGEGEKTTVTTPADRLAPVITSTVTTPERTRPDDLVAALAGGLAALGVLLVVALAAVLRRD